MSNTRNYEDYIASILYLGKSYPYLKITFKILSPYLCFYLGSNTYHSGWREICSYLNHLRIPSAAVCNSPELITLYNSNYITTATTDIATSARTFTNCHYCNCLFAEKNQLSKLVLNSSSTPTAAFTTFTQRQGERGEYSGSYIKDVSYFPAKILVRAPPQDK